jgi:DNA invertase Pin-like site-specific DNA recombinase
MGKRMIGYLRVSTREQADEGFSLDAQRAAIEQRAKLENWDVTFIVDDGYTAKNNNRPGLQEAMRRLHKREFDGLVVIRLDRLARSVQHFASFIDRSNRRGWSVVLLDFNLDTATPNGRLVANILVSVAQWESEMIGQRTAEGMAEAKASGATFGRSRSVADATVTRILSDRSAGLSFAKIAAALDSESIPTPANAKRWYPATVARIHTNARKAA